MNGIVMCGDKSQTNDGSISQKIGERGDLVACLAADIGDSISENGTVKKEDAKQMYQAIQDIEAILESMDTSYKPEGGQHRASAD